LSNTEANNQFVAFLRGINVGGHHKLPMADLKTELKKLGFDNPVTLLNSGNVIFSSNTKSASELDRIISQHLEEVFGFPVPTIVRTAKSVLRLTDTNPFKDIEVTKDIRLYITFLGTDIKTEMKFPWFSPDKSFKIIDIIEGVVVSVLDLAESKSPKAMAALEELFGKDVTTRNWNTIQRICGKISLP